MGIEKQDIESIIQDYKEATGRITKHVQHNVSLFKKGPIPAKIALHSSLFYGFLFDFHPAIKALEALIVTYPTGPIDDKGMLPIIKCFITHPVKEGHASYRAFLDLLTVFHLKTSGSRKPMKPEKVISMANIIVEYMKAGAINEDNLYPFIRYPDPTDYLEIAQTIRQRSESLEQYNSADSQKSNQVFNLVDLPSDIIKNIIGRMLSSHDKKISRDW